MGGERQTRNAQAQEISWSALVVLLLQHQLCCMLYHRSSIGGLSMSCSLISSLLIVGEREDVRWQRAQDGGGRGRSYLQTCITRSGGGEICAWFVSACHHTPPEPRARSSDEAGVAGCGPEFCKIVGSI
jgi:hypothetical protein